LTYTEQLLNVAGNVLGDVRQVKAKLVFANRYLEITWREFFPNQAPAVPVPRLVAYRGQV
jgi:hypothetical protein